MEHEVENTKIEWADHTFNPWIGCTKVSTGCDHCYAEFSFAKRFKTVQWGANQPRKRTSTQYWQAPLKWEKEAHAKIKAYTDFAAQHKLTDEEMMNRGFIKPTRPRVFCASLADVFDNNAPDEWRADLFKLIHETPYLDWLLLTKRIGNAAPMLSRIRHGSDHDLSVLDMKIPNVWIGATICNQEEADRDIPKLIRLPAVKRFLSVEPLLGAVDLSQWLDIIQYEDDAPWMRRNIGHLHDMLDWVIVGGESGPHARPMHPDWARDIRDQCSAANVPFFFKQWGEWCPRGTGYATVEDVPRIRLTINGGDGQQLEATGGHDVWMNKAGHSKTGRFLDGAIYNETP